MTKHEFNIYVELYKRGEYKSIPIGIYHDGTYFYMTDKQIKAMTLLNDSVTTHIGYGGSARSGKTIIECTAIIFDSFSYPGIAWGLARKELTTLKKTVLITLNKQLDFYGIIRDKEYKYSDKYSHITFSNKSQIFLIDSMYKPSDPLNTRFGGFELTKCAADESNESEKSVINKLFERTGWRLNEKYNLKRKLFECFNPQKNHVYYRYYTPYRDNKEPDFKKFIPALPTDNPNPAVKEWVEDMLKTEDEITIQRQIYGNFDYDDDPSALCEYPAILDMFTNEHVIEGKRYISADLAMQGRDKFIGGFWEGFNCHVSIDIPKNDAKVIEDELNDLKNKNGVGNSHIVADSDGLGQFLSAYIKNIKEFHGGKPAKNRVKYARFKDECAWMLAELINKREIRIICSQQQQDNIIKEISICLKRDNTYNDIQKRKLMSKDEMKKRLGHSPDYLDMLIMRMYFELATPIFAG